MGLFQWRDELAGQRIEEYLALLCTQTPSVAHEILNTKIKSVNQWITRWDGTELYTDSIEVAECGCLIGATLLALVKLRPDMVDLEGGGYHGTVPSTVIRGLRAVDGDFGGMSLNDIDTVGRDVMNEVEAALWPRPTYDSYEDYRDAWDEREHAVVFFIKNQIRKNLGIPQLTKPE